MVFDRNENEPEEWDPEEEFYDSESDSLTIPQVSTEEDDSVENPTAIDVPSVSTAETDVPDDILKTFWAVVIVLNAAILVLSLGLMLVVFENDLFHGGSLVGAGVVLFGLAGRRYRRLQDDETETAGDASTDDDSGGTDDGTSSEYRCESDTADKPNASTPEETAETTSGTAPQQRSPNRTDSP